MERRGPATGYFADIAEVEEALALPLLGRLDAEPRFYQLQEVVSRLSPDTHFSERLYRLIETRPLRALIIGLGSAGEEMPVAVGLAERAAIALGAPVLLARLDDAPLEGARRTGVLPVARNELSPLLDEIFPAGCAALPSGIQGVFRVWGGPALSGDPIRPGAIVMACGGCPEQRPSPACVDRVILVVPFRDEPRERIMSEIEHLRGSGYTFSGFVAIGPVGTASGQWDRTRSDVIRPAYTAESSRSEARGEARGEVRRDARDAQVDTRVEARGGEPSQYAEARAGVSSQYAETSGAAPSHYAEARGDVSSPDAQGAGGESPPSGKRVPVSRSWSELFGPRRRRDRNRRIAFWIVIVIVVIAAAAIVLLKKARDQAEPARAVDSESEALHVPPRSGSVYVAAAADNESDPISIADTAFSSNETPEPSRVIAGSSEDESSSPPSAGQEAPLTETVAQPSEPTPSITEMAAEPSDQTSDPAYQTSAPVYQTSDPAYQTLDAPGQPQPSAEQTSEPTEQTSPAIEAMPPIETMSAIETKPPIETKSPQGVTDDAPPVSNQDETGVDIRDMVSTYAGPFAVLCGSYQRADSAAGEAARLNGLGFAARVLAVRLPDKGIWHRVIVGADMDPAEAHQVAQSLIEAQQVAAAQLVGANGWGRPLPN